MRAGIRITSNIRQTNEELAKRVLVLRKQHGLTWELIAKRLGVSMSQLRKIRLLNSQLAL